MKLLAILAMQLAAIVLTLGALGCGSPDAGVVRGVISQDGSLRVVLNDTGVGASGSAVWVTVTVENLGSAALEDFETYLAIELLDEREDRVGDQDEYSLNRYVYDAYYNHYLYEAYSSVCTGQSIGPGESYTDTAQIWDVKATGNIAWGENPLVIVCARDTEGQAFAVDFAVPQPEDKYVW